MPVPKSDGAYRMLAGLAKDAFYYARQMSTTDELSHTFMVTIDDIVTSTTIGEMADLDRKHKSHVQDELKELQNQINTACKSLYGLMEEPFMLKGADEDSIENDSIEIIDDDSGNIGFPDKAYLQQLRCCYPGVWVSSSVAGMFVFPLANGLFSPC